MSTGNAFTVRAGADNAVISNNSVIVASGHGVFITGATGSSVTDTVITGNDFSGFGGALQRGVIYDVGSGTGSAAIHNNSFANFGTGVYAGKGADFMIIGNSFGDNTAGISQTATATAEIANNKFSGTDGEGIGIAAPAFSISGNKFSPLTGTNVHVRRYGGVITVDDFYPSNDFVAGIPQLWTDSMGRATLVD